jgi:esterase/lipase
MVRNKGAVKYRANNQKYESLPDNYLDQIEHIKTPVLFMTGSQNHVFTDSNIKAYDRFRELRKDSGDELFIVNGYGHQDTIQGKNASTDVFPRIIKFLKEHS